ARITSWPFFKNPFERTSPTCPEPKTATLLMGPQDRPPPASRQLIVFIDFMNASHHLAALDLNLLVVLDELLRSRSTTIAARRLGRTQSAVSHSLARLRDALDDPLFVRTGAELRPTTEAERMEAPLRELLAGAEAILTRSRQTFDPKALERTFVIGGTDY